MTANEGLYLLKISEAGAWIERAYGLAPALGIGLAALLGLLAAKWLAAIAAGLPRLIYCEERPQWGGKRNMASAVAILRPRAGGRCPACAHPVRRRQRRQLRGEAGRCGRCGAALRLSYRIMRVLTAGLFAACAWRFGLSLLALCAMGLAAALLVLAWIDFYSGLLPDAITLPLTWAGLLVNLAGVLAPLSQAVLGAVAGYGFLWGVFHLFKFFTGREGMGYGDFKLLAALGAWLGLAAVPWLLLGAAWASGLAGLVLTAAGRVRRGQALPFGPYLAASGMLGLLIAGQWS